MAPQKYRLGLDLGTNSIGWVLLLLNAEGRPKAILRRGEYVPGMGSRIFSDGRDPKSKTSLAVNRRDKRSARRRRWRYKRRRKILMNLLIRLGLMPKNKKERKELASLNPYELRAKALDKPLAPFELGRALFHLDQRRGFQSNRKTTSKEETKKIDPEISGLKKSIKDSGARTLGEFLYWRNKEGAGVRARPGENLYPTRDMYKAEFDAIREQQAQHHPKLTEENWRELLDRIFYQRDLKPQQPGQCQFEPNELRAPRALPSAQKFLIAQDLTNLQWIDLDRKKHPMTEDQRKTLWGKLNSQKTLSFGGIRTALKLPKHIEFNLETDRRKELKGNQTAKLLSDKNYFGNAWRKLDDEQQDEIVEALLEIEEEEPIIKKAVNEWGLDEDRAKNLAKLGPDDFPKGYARFCRQVLQVMVPLMRDGGLGYADAATACGYDHSDQFWDKPILPRLDYYGKLMPDAVWGSNPNAPDEQRRIGKIGNPTVHIGLNQLRLLVNEIIAAFSHPAEIVIELARDLKLNKKQREAKDKKQTRNQKNNERIGKILEGIPVENNPTNRFKYKLWEELSPSNCNDRKCPYSGKPISPLTLFSERVEIEHILPYAQTLNSSPANLTVAFREANQRKGNRSPYEAFGHIDSPDDPYYYQDILARAESLRGNKKWKFHSDAMEDFNDQNKFLERQLNDTRYFSKVAKRYLSHICPANKIWVSKGIYTAFLRRQWGFEKSRDDHRHHALDALVVALVDRKLLQKMSKLNANGNGKIVVPELDKILGHDRETVMREYNRIVVSHRPDHSTAGQLHEENAYGLLKNPTDWEKEQGFNLVYRKKVADLSQGELDAVRDATLRASIKDFTFGKPLKKALAEFSEKTGTRWVRMLKKKLAIKSPKDDFNKYLIPGEIHHVAFWRLPDGKIEAKGLSLFEANQKNKGDPRPHPAAKLILKIHKGDILKLIHKDREKIARVVSLRPVSKIIHLVEHQEAGNLAKRTKDGELENIYLSFSKLKESQARKIHVDALGRVRDSGPIL